LLKADAMKILLLFSILFFTPFQMEAVTMVKLRITGNYFDETAVRFLDAGSPEYDFGIYDAMKMFSPYPDVPGIYTKSLEQYDLAINSFDTLDIDTTIMLYARIRISGNYELKVMDLDLDSEAKVYLEDRQTDSIYELSINAAFNFSLIGDTADLERFRLIFSTPAEMDVSDVTCNGFNDGQLIVADWGNDNWWYEIYDTFGTLIQGNSAVNQVDSITGLSPGSYSIYCNTNQLYTDVFSFSIAEPVPVVALFSCNNTVMLSQGGTLNLNNQSLGAGSYFWDFGDGNTSTDLNPTHTYLSPGNYTVSLTATNGNCGDQYVQQIDVIGQTTTISSNTSSNITIWSYGKQLNIKTKSGLEEPLDIRIYNMNGKLILQKQFIATSSTNHQLNFNTTAGMYTVSVSTTNYQHSETVYFH
jgi:hypothetical protein